MTASTRFSVVIPTFNRAGRLRSAIGSVLAQTVAPLEVVVVDDGSTDATPDVVAAIDDPRVRCVRQENRGLSAARNAGAAAASGDWLTFLDDDDEALPGWLAIFGREASDPRCGVVCCGKVFVDEGGRTLRTALPQALGPAYENQVGSFMGGTFAVQRELFEAVGGYTAGLRTSHGTELAFRLVPYCLARDLEVRSVPEPGIRIEARPATRRSRGDPEALLAGVSYILENHGERVRRSARTYANYASIAGVSSARLGMYRQARRFLASAARAQPRAPVRWARLLLTLVPPLADRVWRGRGTG